MVEGIQAISERDQLQIRKNIESGLSAARGSIHHYSCPQADRILPVGKP